MSIELRVVDGGDEDERATMRARGGADEDTADDDTVALLEEAPALGGGAGGDGSGDGSGIGAAAGGGSSSSSSSSSKNNEDGGGEDDPDDRQVTMEDVVHSVQSFVAVAVPVGLCMALAALAVTYLQDARSVPPKIMVVYHDVAGDDNATRLAHALANSLAVILVLVPATLLIVCLYWLNWMRPLYGFLMWTCATMLGTLGGGFAQPLRDGSSVGVGLGVNALMVWGAHVDAFSWYLLVWNFAIVGVLAIFWQKGLSPRVAQACLVYGAVAMAYNLDRTFPQWTAWALLVALCFYDLAAVLCAYGPLNLLVGLVQKERRPLPGLLYEAALPASAMDEDSEGEDEEEEGEGEGEGERGGHRDGGGGRGGGSSAGDGLGDVELRRRVSDKQQPEAAGTAAAGGGAGGGGGGGGKCQRYRYDGSWLDFLAEFYGKHAPERLAPGAAQPLDVASLAASFATEERELLRQLDAKYGTRHAATLRRFEEWERPDNSIKLGLGDFIFYSLLVSRAASDGGWVPAASCALVIEAGLGATLFLVSVTQSALPALPISIGLGVAAFVLAHFLLAPFLAELAPLGVAL